MPCYRPLKGYRSATLNPSGKRSIVFTIHGAFHDLPVTLPCGSCIGCRLECSRQWALRCVHEASLYEHNSFLTLTYSPDNLPSSGSLVKSHFQEFMKNLRHLRFRKRRNYWTWDPVLVTDRKRNLRYFQAGEYGESLGRPPLSRLFI